MTDKLKARYRITANVVTMRENGSSEDEIGKYLESCLISVSDKRIVRDSAKAYKMFKELSQNTAYRTMAIYDHINGELGICGSSVWKLVKMVDYYREGGEA